MKIIKLFFTVTFIILTITQYRVLENISVLFMLRFVSIFASIFILTMYLYGNNKLLVKKIDIVKFMLIAVASLLNLFIYEGTSILFNSSFITMCLFILAVVIFVFPSIEDSVLDNIIKLLFWVLVIFVFLPNFVLTFDPSKYYVQGERIRFVGMFNNANSLGAHLYLLIIISVKLSSNQNMIRYKWVYFVIIFGSIYTIILANSRTPLIATLILFFIGFYLWVFRKIESKTKVIFVQLMIIICFLLVVLFSNKYLPGVSFSELDKLSSSRLSIWNSVLTERSIVNQFFGNGSTRDGLYSNLVITNGYVELLYYFGIIGFLFWIILIFTSPMFKESAKSKNKNITKYAIIISMFIYFIGEGGIVSFSNVISLYFWIELSNRSSVYSSA
ncbi:O-antigen ligase family protein [Bacillus sp. NTK034]|uniref:O-antigen ligase family protein n=1 Tax=Bacillus sp. NTK034 TaxID=2802176 RepID=UPI001A8D0EE0|nr:hypothetical protein [Bacillus sp. NTK034]MBN8201816.1 hypothetical protein [Bacillus sp. NTK034]